MKEYKYHKHKKQKTKLVRLFLSPRILQIKQWLRNKNKNETVESINIKNGNVILRKKQGKYVTQSQ